MDTEDQRDASLRRIKETLAAYQIAVKEYGQIIDNLLHARNDPHTLEIAAAYRAMAQAKVREAESKLSKF
jgi:CHASE3 domain sensor protein